MSIGSLMAEANTRPASGLIHITIVYGPLCGTTLHRKPDEIRQRRIDRAICDHIAGIARERIEGHATAAGGHDRRERESHH